MVLGHREQDLATGIDACAVGKLKIHENQIGFVETNPAYCVLDGPGFTRHMDVVLSLESAQPLADDRVIVDDKYSDNGFRHEQNANQGCFGVPGP